MDSFTIYDSAMHRQSVRHLEVHTLPSDALDEVCEALEDVKPLLPDRQTQLMVYQHGELKGYSPYGIAAFAENTRESWINAGYMLEQMDLWFSSRGLGSCWLGAATPPAGMTPPGLVYMGSVCFGVPIGEVHREDPDDIRRKPLDAITDIEDPNPVLDLARMAPSALNRQPWFFSGTKNDMILTTGSRVLVGRTLTLLDTGIVLLYIRIAATHMEQGCNISLREPEGIQIPEGRVFQARITLKDIPQDGELQF